MTVVVKVNLLSQLNKKMESLIKKNVYVGIPSDHNSRDESGPVTNAQLGYINEFGSAANNIPPRPFLVPGVKEASEKISGSLKEIDLSSSSDLDLDVALNKAGLVASQTVKRRIVKSTGIKPLKESTIRAKRNRKVRPAKGKITPLIDTGQMLNSITYVVRDS